MPRPRARRPPVHAAGVAIVASIVVGVSGSVPVTAVAASAVAVVLLLCASACAPFHRNQPIARPADLELRIAALSAELDGVRARLDSTSAQADSLRLELQRLKEIDLKPRAPRRPLR